MNAIPEDFIKRQVDVLLEMAGRMPDGPFRDAVLVRVDHYMDLVKAWRAENTSTAAPE